LASSISRKPTEEKIASINNNTSDIIEVKTKKLPEVNIVSIPEELLKPEIKADLGKALTDKELVEDNPKDTNRFANRLRDGKKVKMVATAYCLNGRTASGVFSKYGIIAADPIYLPIGSIVRIRGGEYTGLYSVLDTGAKIKGRKIDIYLASGREAMQFGRRDVTLEVLRYGWNPQICNDIVLGEQKILSSANSYDAERR
jgi:3D (Asp-Asp-Asp) domain-containing protein